MWIRWSNVSQIYSFSYFLTTRHFWVQRANQRELCLTQNLRRLWKTDHLHGSPSVILQHSEPHIRVDRAQLWYSFCLILVLYCWDLYTLLSILNTFMALTKRSLISLPVYMRFITPLTIYLGRSSPCQVRCFNVTCSFFFAVFAELVSARDFRLCKKQ